MKKITFPYETIQGTNLIKYPEEDKTLFDNVKIVGSEVIADYYGTVTTYTEYTPPFESLQQLKLQALIEKKNADFEAMMSGYDEFEKETFRDRSDEAKAWVKDDTTPTPFINASLPAGYTTADREVEINAVYQKALGIAQLGGISRDLRNAIENATTIAELEAIVI